MLNRVRKAIKQTRVSRAQVCALSLVSIGVCGALLGGCSAPDQDSPQTQGNQAIQPAIQHAPPPVNPNVPKVSVPAPAMPSQQSRAVQPATVERMQSAPSQTPTATEAVEGMLSLVENASSEQELTAIAVNAEAVARKCDRASTDALMNNRQNTSWGLGFLRNAYDYTANCARLKIKILKWGDSDSQTSYSVQLGLARKEASRAQSLLGQPQSASQQPSREQTESSIENSMQAAHQPRRR